MAVYRKHLYKFSNETSGPGKPQFRTAVMTGCGQGQDRTVLCSVLWASVGGKIAELPEAKGNGEIQPYGLLSLEFKATVSMATVAAAAG